jgi:septin family protein
MKYVSYIFRLRPVDIMVMKKLHHKVNIIPLIAKSDMLTKPEVKRLKEQVKFNLYCDLLVIVT